MTPQPSNTKPVSELLQAGADALSRVDVNGTAMPVSLNVGYAKKYLAPGERYTNRHDRRREKALNKAIEKGIAEKPLPDIAIIGGKQYKLANYLVTAIDAQGRPDELTAVTAEMKIDQSNVYIQMYVPAEALGY